MAASLYLDESVDIQLAVRLTIEGYDVLTAVEAGRLHVSDLLQLEFASQQGRILFTDDLRDYPRLAREWAAEGREHAGIIYSPFRSTAVLIEWINSLFALYSQDDLRNVTLSLPVQE